MPKAPKEPSNRREARSDPLKSSEEKKDLIKIRNVNNGQIYKFACLTCINGHRAPQCDPIKHRNKILFRRPTPGRPARHCGHTADTMCDCRAQRNLCTNLNSAQWDELVAGRIPTAKMFDCVEDLDAAEKKAKLAAERAQAANPYTYQQISVPYRPVPPSMRFGYSDPMAQYHPYPQYPQPPQRHFVGNQPAPPTMFQQPQYQSAAPLPWTDGNHGQVYGGQMDGVQDPNSYPSFAPQMMPMPANTQPGMPAPPVFNAYNPQSYEPQAQMHALQQYSLDMGHQEQLAAQPSSNPTQSCCSMRPPPQPQQPFTGTTPTFNIPGPTPRSQFPCQSCASYQCQCVTCPEVRQVPSGAWQQSCGRGGHIDNTVLPKQEYTSPQEYTPSQKFTPSGEYTPSRGYTSSQEPEDAFQGYQEFHDPPQDYPHMQPIQQPAQHPALDISQLAAIQEFVQAQPVYDPTSSNFHDPTHIGLVESMHANFQDTTQASLNEMMSFQDAMHVDPADTMSTHIENEIDGLGDMQELPSIPFEGFVDPNQIRWDP